MEQAWSPLEARAILGALHAKSNSACRAGCGGETGCGMVGPQTHRLFHLSHHFLWLWMVMVIVDDNGWIPLSPIDLVMVIVIGNEQWLLLMDNSDGFPFIVGNC